MEFWGVEIKPGQTITVPPVEGKLLHVSQASLGEHKKETGNDSIILSLKVEDKTFVLGTLSAGKTPQISYDLVFEREFELSHNWKNGSVYYVGYLADNHDDDDEDINDFYPDSSDEEADLQLPVVNTANGKPEPKAGKSKVAVPIEGVTKLSKPVEAKKGDESDDDSEESSDEDDDDVADLGVDSGDSEGSDESDDMSDDSDEDEMDEDEETPKKAEPENKKKRPTDSLTKTPVPAKKVKVASPQKTDGKKGTVHSATPYPKKVVAKTPAANAEKSKAPATPKSGGSIGCKSCSKKFNSDKALESHSKAKHEAK